MNNDPFSNPIDEGGTTSRTTMFLMIGAVIVGACALVFLAFLWFRPDTNSLVAEYFPSPTPTRQPTGTPAPTRTAIPNLTATQQAWVKPALPPSLGSIQEAREALESGGMYLEAFSSVYPDTPEINQPGDVYIYEVQLSESIPLIWSYGWCTTTQAILDENFTHIELEFTINEALAPFSNFVVNDYERSDGASCREHAALVADWTPGQHILETRITFTQDIDDGWNLYPAGMHAFKYIVTLQP